MNGDLEAIKKEAEIVIIGGGIIGATVFRELCAAGANVVLLEKDDFCCDISSGSTEMAHGGFRYLLTLNDWPLVVESIVEREILHFIAPHLVRRLHFYMPLYKGDEMYFNPSFLSLNLGDITWRIGKYSGIGAMMVGSGMEMYKLFAVGGMKKCPRSADKGEVAYKKLNAEQFLGLGFRVNPEGLVAAYNYTDSKIEDVERLVTENILSGLEASKERGTACAAFNMTEATNISASGEVVARDKYRGKEIVFKPKAIINAAGAGINNINGLLNPEARGDVHTVAGSHFLISRERNWDSSDEQAAIAWWTKRKIMFAISKGTDRLLIGTHERYVTQKEIDKRNLNYAADLEGIIQNAGRVFPKIDINIERDLYYTRARPLRADQKLVENANPTRFSRRDYIREIGKMISVTGKIGPSRFLAQTVAGKAITKIGRARFESTTGLTPLYGGAIDGKLEDYIQSEVAANPHVNAKTISNLVKRYGCRYRDVINGGNGAELEPINPAAPDSLPMSALLYSFDREGARNMIHAFRRTGTYRHLDEGRGCIEKATKYIAAAQGWNAEKTAEEIKGYLQYTDAVKRRV